MSGKRAARGSIARGLVGAVVVGVCLAAAAPEARGDEPKSMTYETGKGVTYVVTADGLSSIRVGERELATGGWRASSGEGWFKAGTGKVQSGKVVEKSVEIVSPTKAVVRHVGDGDVDAVHTYTFDGEDVTISTRVENRHPTDDMTVVHLSGLRFEFDRPPRGVMNWQHVSYFQAHGLKLCHPSHYSRIGGSYAVDGSAGVGVSPSDIGLTRTLILWYFTDWKRQLDSPGRTLHYFVVSPTPARGAATFDLKLRVSPDRDWKHLLAPYREHFQATFGPVQYKTDARWISTHYANHSPQAISPENPYGFHGGWSRLDLPEGAKEFADRHLKALTEGNGQGVILWGQGGQEPRGGMYRPDFDILPPEVAENWKLLQQRFADADKALGVTTRPRHLAVRRNWRSDMIIDINPDDAGHRRMLWNRFKNMMDRGVTLFYLDSFGTSLEDVKLMRYLREQMGPDVRTFAEHQSDAIMPWSGGYSETTLRVADDGTGSYGLWSGLRNWEIYRWLCPGATMTSRLYRTEGGEPGEDVPPVEAFFYANRITPLLPYLNTRLTTDELAELQAKYVDEDGQWKSD